MCPSFRSWTADSAVCLCGSDRDRVLKKKDAGYAPEIGPGTSGIHATTRQQMVDPIGCLIFLDDDGVLFTDFHTAFASHAFFRIDRHGFSVLHLENLHRAYVYTFFTTNAFGFVNNRGKCHFYSLLKIKLKN
jgi:hypothetical protein